MIVSGVDEFDAGDGWILLHIVSGRFRGSEYRRCRGVVCVEAEVKTKG